MGRVIIAGAGPTGATLALLLVKHGIGVTLIEAARDFHREFRGEGLMPSGLDALEQMGLSTLLEGVPHRKLDGWEFILDNKTLFRVTEPLGGDRSCTLVSQPHLLEALVREAKLYTDFEFIEGIAVKDLIRDDNRVTGVKLADGRQIYGDLVIGADGRNSLIRQRAGLELVKQPNNIDVLWFKMPANPDFSDNNVFYSILNKNRGFSVFHGAEAGKLHLAWVLETGEKIERDAKEWAKTFAYLSPEPLATHFRGCGDRIGSPLKLSVVVGRCLVWYTPGVIVLGDAAHPMSPVRAQGINMALRDVIVTANHLVPLLKEGASGERIDRELPAIQREREPEIIGARELQKREADRGEGLRDNKLKRTFLITIAPFIRDNIAASWVKSQKELREGITRVKLTV